VQKIEDPSNNKPAKENDKPFRTKYNLKFKIHAPQHTSKHMEKPLKGFITLISRSYEIHCY
jgi:hypothetical protein